MSAPALDPDGRPGGSRSRPDERLLSNVRAFLRRGKRPSAGDVRRPPTSAPPADPRRRPR